MKIVLQRVSEAYVSVDGRMEGSIGRGLLVLVCIEKGDDAARVEHYAEKVAELRIFSDEAGKMNLSVKDVRGEVLIVSQFTLAADAEKGRRPSFDRAAAPDVAIPLYHHFVQKVADQGVRVATGVFQAMMKVGLVNDGPVTILLG